MADENVIYTDGHDVKVTPFQFIVGNRHYKLEGVSNVQMHSISPNRTPAIILMLLGIAGIICGMLNLMPLDVFSVGNFFITSNKLCLLIGGLLLVIGIAGLAMLHTRYAVRITTAEGEKNTVISPEKDYINQIVIAINSAFQMAHY